MRTKAYIVTFGANPTNNVDIEGFSSVRPTYLRIFVISNLLSIISVLKFRYVLLAGDTYNFNLPQLYIATVGKSNQNISSSSSFTLSSNTVYNVTGGLSIVAFFTSFNLTTTVSNFIDFDLTV